MDDTGGSEAPPADDNDNLFSKLFDKLKGWFDSLGESIGDNFNKALSSINSLKDNITTWFSDLIEKIKGLIQLVTDIPKYLDTLFNINSEHLPPYEPRDLITDKLLFVQQFKTAIGNFSNGGKPLVLPPVEIFGASIPINFNWFEPHRTKVRSGISSLFWVMCALSCWRIVSNVFGIGVNVSSGIVMSEIRNKGGDSD